MRARIQRLEAGPSRQPELPTHPALAGLVRLRAGGSYEVDSLALALALMAEPSRLGAWSAVVGIADLGWEAAAGIGVDLSRTVMVPDPGDQWVEVVAALAEVVTVVVLRPPARVSERVQSRLGARLRNGAAALVVWGSWPRSDARLMLREQCWSGEGWAGPGRGEGRLHARRASVDVRRGAGPRRSAALWLPSPDGVVVAVEPR